MTPGSSDEPQRTAELDRWGTFVVDRVLDMRGETCPRPQLFTKKVVTKEMSAGQVLELVVDNPSSPELVPTIMDDIHAVHLGTLRKGADWRLYIRKGGEAAATPLDQAAAGHAATAAALPIGATARGAARVERGRRLGGHGWFLGGMIALSFAVLGGLFVGIGNQVVPASYVGLQGFPKIGTLPNKVDGVVVTFVFAFIVGFLIQRSRWCNASAIRDAILFKSFRNTKPLLAAMAVITAMFTIFEAMDVGQPINIVGGAFTVLGLFLFGIGMVLGGACTVSVWIRSAEGSVAAVIALAYTFAGMFLFSELWNILRWPAANYLQSATPNLSILSFGEFNAMSIRSMFGPLWGPVMVVVAGSLQVLVLIFMYRKMTSVEARARRARVPVMAGAGAAQAVGLPAAAAPGSPTAASPGPVGVGNGAAMIALGGAPPFSVDRVLDLSGETCPRPQLFTKKVVTREMQVGQILELVVDNPSSPELVPTIMADIGATHLGTVRGGHDWKLYIRKDRESVTMKGMTKR